jgi:hypothetical protein
VAKDKALRQHLLNMLKGSDAHVAFDSAIKDVPLNLRGKRPNGAEHSPWQWDILEFSRKPNHRSPDFPGGYWPSAQAPPNEKVWDQSVQAFRKGLEAFCELVADESINLFATVPSGDNQTFLREALLVADHNAYHLGELVLLRRLLGAWQ